MNTNEENRVPNEPAENEDIVREDAATPSENGKAEEIISLLADMLIAGKNHPEDEASEDKSGFTEETENEEKDVLEDSSEPENTEAFSSAPEEDTGSDGPLPYIEDDDEEEETEDVTAGSDEQASPSEEDDFFVVEEEEEDDIADVAVDLIGTDENPILAHSDPIKTRSPEQNKSVTNGIPVRTAQAESRENEEIRKELKEKERKSDRLFRRIIIIGILAAVAIVLLSILLNKVNESINRHTADFNPVASLESGDEENRIIPISTDNVPQKQFMVKIDFYDRTDIVVSTDGKTLAELLSSIGCVLYDGEVPSMPLDEVIKQDMTITVDKYEYKTETKEETIPFETEKIETDLIMRGTSNQIQEGEDGLKEIEYKIVFVNGRETEKTVVSETVLKEPVTEKVEYGVGGELVGADGRTYTYSMKKIVPATYYNIPGLTYLGTYADESVIAVDMNVMPLGTRVYVKNDRYDFGVRIASDVGGGVKGDLIDIWLSPSNPQYASFAAVGYHYDMEIYFLD